MKTDFMIDFKTKICRGGAGRKKLTEQELLTSEQRRKELQHQTYLRNKEKRKKTYIDKCRKLTDLEKLASEQRRKELQHQTYLRNKEKRKKTYIDKCRKLTDLEQLASEQRRKKLKYQTYLRNKEERKKTYIDRRDHINDTRRKTYLVRTEEKIKQDAEKEIIRYQSKLVMKNQGRLLIAAHFNNDDHQHYLGPMNYDCIHCKALHWLDESTQRSSKSFYDCCAHGKVVLDSLPEYPDDLFNK
ncbi:hypothetical protein L798_05665 [Zootermopsis nevadensis]|uniref:Uncharacterized protein n=1 Tax=Zootermopsis nevadensis TaxID=136037 RepID=A0A067RIC1_ZOONE|nr:hypothetical protein L798_05665 [Zootermopsis nevadensis]